MIFATDADDTSRPRIDCGSDAIANLVKITRLGPYQKHYVTKHSRNVHRRHLVIDGPAARLQKTFLRTSPCIVRG
jgi:hypothetical protein